MRQGTMHPLAELEVVGADCLDKVARFGGTHDRRGDEPVAQDPCQCGFGHGDATASRERLDASRVRAQQENALIRWTRSGRGDGVCPNPATHVLVSDRELDAAREVVPDDYSRVDLHGVWTEPDPSPTRLGLRVTSNWQCVLAEFLIGEGLQSVVGGDTLQDAVVHHAVDTGAVSLVGSHARTSLHQATKIRLERIEHMFYY